MKQDDRIAELRSALLEAIKQHVDQITYDPYLADIAGYVLGEDLDQIVEFKALTSPPVDGPDVYTRMGVQVVMVGRVFTESETEFIRCVYCNTDSESFNGTIRDLSLFDLRGEDLFRQVGELPILEDKRNPVDV